MYVCVVCVCCVCLLSVCNEYSFNKNNNENSSESKTKLMKIFCLSFFFFSVLRVSVHINNNLYAIFAICEFHHDYYLRTQN